MKTIAIFDIDRTFAYYPESYLFDIQHTDTKFLENLLVNDTVKKEFDKLVKLDVDIKFVTGRSGELFDITQKWLVNQIKNYPITSSNLFTRELLHYSMRYVSKLNTIKQLTIDTFLSIKESMYFIIFDDELCMLKAIKNLFNAYEYIIPYNVHFDFELIQVTGNHLFLIDSSQTMNLVINTLK